MYHYLICKKKKKKKKKKKSIFKQSLTVFLLDWLSYQGLRD